MVDPTFKAEEVVAFNVSKRPNGYWFWELTVDSKTWLSGHAWNCMMARFHIKRAIKKYDKFQKLAVR